MDILRQIGALLWARFWNLYTLRAILVAAIAAIAPAIDPRFAAELTRLVDALIGGDASVGMLAIFGGGYVLLDMIRARRKAMPEAGPDRSWRFK